MDKSISSLYTYRYFKQTFIYVMSGLMGSVFGIMGAIGWAMKFFEKGSLKVKKFAEKENVIKKIKENGKDLRLNMTLDEQNESNFGILTENKDESGRTSTGKAHLICA